MHFANMFFEKLSRKVKIFFFKLPKTGFNPIFLYHILKGVWDVSTTVFLASKSFCFKAKVIFLSMNLTFHWISWP